MVSHTLYKKNLGQFQKKKLPIYFSNALFSSKTLKRQFPIQNALHIVLDGALVGVLITVAIMSSVALHSQYLWTEAFTKLERTRELSRRMIESTSILESYLLQNQKFAKDLVPTKAENLIYLDRPIAQNINSSVKEKLTKNFLERISGLPIKSGY